MPTYGYECLSCDNQFETFQSIKDDALTTCDTCGGSLRKRVYPVGIAFKGSGFYVNDYAPKSGGGSGTTKTEDAKTEETKSEETKSDTKTEKSKPVKTETTKTETAKTETKPEKTSAKTPAAAS